MMSIPSNLRQILVICVLSVALGVFFNTIRPKGIPFIGDWSTEGRLVADDGESVTISPLEAKKFFHEKKAVFIDARDEDQFTQGHIKDAESLPWHSVEASAMDIINKLSNDTFIITYCDGETCDLSHELAVFLKNMGFMNVKVLVNGYTIWQEMGLPVEGLSFKNHKESN